LHTLSTKDQQAITRNSLQRGSTGMLTTSTSFGRLPNVNQSFKDVNEALHSQTLGPGVFAAPERQSYQYKSYQKMKQDRKRNWYSPVHAQDKDGRNVTTSSSYGCWAQSDTWRPDGRLSASLGREASGIGAKPIGARGAPGYTGRVYCRETRYAESLRRATKGGPGYDGQFST